MFREKRERFGGPGVRLSPDDVSEGHGLAGVRRRTDHVFVMVLPKG